MRKMHFKSSSAHLTNKITLEQALDKFTTVNPDILVHGGRQEAIKQLRIAAKNIKHYAQTRDELSKPTSQLSAFIKFGNISVREVYYSFKSNHPFIRQIYWRDFYAGILYSFPRVLGHALKPKYDKIKWHHNEKWFEAWKNGVTGIPIVDASQRQLIATGWSHNRGRMISSSILIKILLIDWRKGEKFYAQHLVDYDVASNNGGWQWAAGTGCDAAPYFRVFNPYLQTQKFDPELKYIKKWVPEYDQLTYPRPIVEHDFARKRCLEVYKKGLDR
jgi:deoxyribodipyrimidine photo-lyase